MEYFNNLLKKIETKEAKVAVIGLGYVGLNLAKEIATNGYKVIGIDIDNEKVKKINEGISYIDNVKNEEIKELVKKGLLKATTEYKEINECDIIILALPTPLDENKKPNLKFILDSLDSSLEFLKEGQLLILESTTYVGTTEEIIAPKLLEKGFKIGESFFLAYSPERIDIGNKNYPLKKIPKIVAGVTKKCTELTNSFYKKIVNEIFVASSPKVAEFTKLFENVFRLINIAYVFEIAKLCEKLNIDVWEVIELAKTKPFGFMPFYPSAGAGGDCIPINPYYLTWKAKEVNEELNLIKTATKINEEMYEHIMNKIKQILLEKRKKEIKDSKILIIGVSYKKDVSDIRNSPSLKIIQELINNGAKVNYFDPYVPFLELEKVKLKSINLTEEEIKDQDLIVIITDHTSINYEKIFENSDLIFDTRNVFKKNDPKIIKLGSG